jgi:hypothetical protein
VGVSEIGTKNQNSQPLERGSSRPPALLLLATYICREQTSSPRGHHHRLQYFDSAGRESAYFRALTLTPSWPITPFWIATCPSLTTYLDTSSQRVFLSYKRIKYNASPNHDWLPATPDLSSFNASSRWANTACSSQRLRILLSRHDSHASQCPNPDGLGSSQAQHSSYRHIAPPPIPQSYYCHIPHAPVQAIFTGVDFGSHGGMSPLTHQGSGSVGGGASVAGPRSMGAPWQVRDQWGHSKYSSGSQRPVHLFHKNLNPNLHPSCATRYQLGRLRS